jgi:hypothetical protein
VDAPPHLLEALRSWYQDQVDRGLSADALPHDVDLQTIASTPGVTRPMLDGLQLRNREAVNQFASGILSAIKAAHRAAAQNTATVPPVTMPAVVPVVSAPPAPPNESPDAAVDFSSRSPRQSSTTRGRSSAGPGGGSTAATPPPSTDFVRYDAAHHVRPPFVLPPHLKNEGGRLQIEWEPTGQPGGVEVYRVVSSDVSPPYSPDSADQVQVVISPRAEDTRPHPSSLRYLQVWAYVGATEAEARATQPVLHREDVIVAPPANVEFTELDGAVIISWQTPRGIDHVEVHRLPVEESDGGAFPDQWVLSRDPARNSFQDTTCKPGQEYEYRVVSVLRDSSQQDRVSDPVRKRLRPSTSLTPIRELRLRERVDGRRTFLDLEWDQPATAEIVIYLTAAPPASGADERDVPVTQLPETGLRMADRQRHDIVVVDGVARMTDVIWPNGWQRVHLTAVTISGTAARLGATATRTRTASVTDVRLLQRVKWQLLTFTWPVGAAAVNVYQTRPGTTMDDEPSDPIKVMVERDWVRDGGTQLQLPWDGCELHLVPVTYYARETVKGVPATVSYPGLLTLEYRLSSAEPAVQGGRFGGPAAPAAPPRRNVEVRVVPALASGPPTQVAVVFTLVSSRDRLPLSVQDADQKLGASPYMVPVGGDPAWIPLAPIDLSPLRGQYLRLFAQLESPGGHPIALLDPDLESLRPS